MDSDVGWFESIVLFIAILLTALVDSIGNSVLNNISAISILALLVAAGIAAYRCYIYKVNGINIIVAVIFTFISEMSFTCYLLLCLRDIALVATSGGLFLSLIGVLLSLPVACFTVFLCKIPNMIATSSGHETFLVVTDGVATFALVYLFCHYFGFSVTWLFS